MFTADLSWTDPNTESVGERRERKARERATKARSIDTNFSSRSSISCERELWWTSGLRKAKSIKPKIVRPIAIHGSGSQQTVPFSPRHQRDISQTSATKDPVLQPPWTTYSTTLSSNLPSGLPLDPTVSEVPELEGDSSSRCTNSTELRASVDRLPPVSTPDTAISAEGAQEQQSSPESFVTSRTRRSSTTTECDESVTLSPSSSQKGWEPDHNALCADGTSMLANLQLCDSVQDFKTAAEQKPIDYVRNDSVTGPPPKRLSQWESLMPRNVPKEMRLTHKPAVNRSAVAHSSNVSLSRFQRFIRRMENAGPKIILDRLREDWESVSGDVADEEVALEKQLWLLTGFEMQHLGRDQKTPVPLCDTGRILELYGNLSEVYQSSAMHPTQTVHFLTTKPQRPLPLPGNVSYLTVRDCGTIPLPYPEVYFGHIRASTLPTVVRSSKLPDLFSECYKLLAPGGLFEIRVMDVAPLRKTAGPLMRMWMDERLSVKLEKQFRCSKPCSLVPAWLEEAGFELVVPDDNHNSTLPCAYDAATGSVEQELASAIAQTLWKDLWGSFVEDVPDEPKWWWDDEAVVQECVQNQTMLVCKSIFAYRR